MNNGRSELDSGSEVDNSEVSGDKVEDNKIARKKNYQKISKSKKMVSFLEFFIFGARLMFTKLKQAFIKAPILYNFDLECYIRIKINISDYAIGRILNILT